MYTQFYGLREKPFSLSPDPRFLYLSDAHREALAHLLYGIEQGEGFIAITGEVGTGKTTLCRTLLQRLEPGTEVAFIFNPQLSGVELLESINAEFGLPTDGASRRVLTEQLNRFLLAKKREDRRVLLLVDEAQALERDALEQVRLLSNLETDTEKLLQIVLIGQPELDTMLESPELRQLRQRISVRWRLSPLSSDETREYVRHRLRIAAGAPRELFTELALREIHRRSGGIPRLVNLLCDRTLLAGYASGAPSIGLGLVTQTRNELRESSGAARREPVPGLGFLRRWLPAAALLAILLLAGAGGLWWARRGPAAAQATAASAAGPAPVATPPTAGPAAAPAGPTAAPDGPGTAAAVAGAADGPGAADLPRPETPGAAPTLPASGGPPFGAGPAVAAAPPPTPSAAPGNAAGSDAPPGASGSGGVASPDLGTALARSSPAATTAASLDALLRAWGVPEVGAELLSLPQALAALRGQGLATLALRGADAAALRSLDQPALLVLTALDGASRTAMLRRLDDGGDAVLLGIAPEPLRVPFAELAQHWDGEAYVPWKDFEALPPVIGPESSGAPVAWLQHMLGRLGHYGGRPTGEFDADTIAAVRRLQGDAALQVDGTVGPETKIRLYQAMGTYPVPRLDAGREAS